MKKVLFFLLGFSILFITCKREISNETNRDVIKAYEEVKILNEPVPLDDKLILPSGTKWHYVNKEKSEVILELPDDYVFLLVNPETNQYRLVKEAGYKCDCSEGGGCVVFYNTNLGFGCLHGDCKGACTGTKTSGRANIGYSIEGIIEIIVPEDAVHRLSFEPQGKSYLTDKGKEIFFKLPETKEAIEGFYNLHYLVQDLPDSWDLEDIFRNDSYFLASVYLNGVEFAVVLPEAVTESYLGKIKVPTKCTCHTADDGCEFKTAGFGKYKIYYCTAGCGSCELH